MLLRIVHYNEPVLRKKGEKIAVFDAALNQLACDMIETMHASDGIGLAAQQVGHPIHLCVVDLSRVESDFDWAFNGARPPLELFMPLVLVNPRVEAVPQPTTVCEEGCLSFPKIRGDVVRPDEIAVDFQDTAGNVHTLRCNGMFARCIQHEVDHLNGVFFIDSGRMDKAVRAKLEPAIKELKKQTQERARAAAAAAK
ncbi:MAG: peptide deformylase [Opitutaceae bacterium]|nr:peptide deformylase [Opitutaceae bacterium]